MSRPTRARPGVLRSVSGVLAGGLVALTLALGVAWLVADLQGWPGPGPSTLLSHALGAAVAVAVQVHADRTPGPRGVLAALAVVAVVLATLVLQWLV